MAPSLPALPRSESKTRFMQCLGLDIRDPRHRQVYNLMKAEAIDGRQRIIAIINSPRRPSIPECAIATSQIPEGVMNQEISRIHRIAQRATRILYDLAIDRSHPDEPNWIIRWMLWHVIRYRDRRQQNGTEEGAAEEVSGDETTRMSSLSLEPTVSAAITESSSTSSSAGPSSARHYDPVRDEWNQ